MSSSHLLDTSALLAHYREEPGYEVVERLLEEHPEEVCISAISWLEFHVHMKVLVPDAKARAESLAIYEELLAEALPATREVARAAFDLREQLAERIPNGDALIAATAWLRGAKLVHRDPHFSRIPETLLQQIVLPSKSKAPQPKLKPSGPSS